MKNFKLLAAALLTVPFAQAQTMAEAIKKTDNERYDAASADFVKLIAAEPSNTKLYFYYGENLFEQDEPEKAKVQWEKGISINPKCELNIVGRGKYNWYKGDTTAGRTDFNTALATTKNKNAEVMRQIAEVLIDAPKKDLKGAVALLDRAIKLEPKNTENYLLKGDALLGLNPTDGSPGIKSYNEALAIDPQNVKTLVKKAQLYERVGNTKLAEEEYTKAVNLDATYAPAYRLLAELYLAGRRPKEGVTNYEKYLQLNDDKDARRRYATALYISGNYCELLPQLEKLEAQGVNDMYTVRMRSVGIYQCNLAGEKSVDKYNEALRVSDAFLKMADQSKIVGGDYGNRGRIYQALGNDSLAIMEFEKAITMDPNSASSVYDDLIKLYTKKENFTKMVETYNRKVKGDLSKLNVTENYDLGKALYFEGKDFVAADSAFARVNRQSPTYVIGYIWKGRTAYKLDDPKNPQWLAFPAYSKYFEVIKPEDRAKASYNDYTAEAARYLGDYYIRGPQKDTAKAKEYWGIVRTLFPNDPQAKAFFASPAGK